MNQKVKVHLKDARSPIKPPEAIAVLVRFKGYAMTHSTKNAK
jgi:hypothetical protein